MRKKATSVFNKKIDNIIQKGKKLKNSNPIPLLCVPISIIVKNVERIEYNGNR